MDFGKMEFYLLKIHLQQLICPFFDCRPFNTRVSTTKQQKLNIELNVKPLSRHRNRFSWRSCRLRGSCWAEIRSGIYSDITDETNKGSSEGAKQIYLTYDVIHIYSEQPRLKGWRTETPLKMITTLKASKRSVLLKLQGYSKKKGFIKNEWSKARVVLNE